MNKNKDTKKCLMIVGAGEEQIYAYKLAKKMGLYVVGTDKNPDAPGFNYADKKLIASTRNVDETLHHARIFNKSRKINGVITLANDVPYTIAKVANNLNLPSISIQTAKISSNKLIMKKLFLENGIPSPFFEEVFSSIDIKNKIEKWGYPIIIKPIDGRGSRGVLRITEDIDLDWAFEFSKKFSDKGFIIAEKFVDGSQLSTESIVYKGICYTSIVTSRNYEYLEKYKPFIVENGGLAPANLSKKEIDDVHKLLEKVANSLKIYNGTIKGDLVLSSNGPQIIEVATRLSGGYLCTDQIPMTTGIDLVEQNIKLSLGEELDINQLFPKDLCKLAIRYFFAEPGIVKKIIGFDELENFDWIVKKKLFIKVGDKIGEMDGTNSKIGFIHAMGDTHKESLDRALKAISTVRIITE